MATSDSKESITDRKLTGPCIPEYINVTSNKDKNNNVSLTGGFIRLMYYESLLSDTIRATVTWDDSGDSTNNQKKGGDSEEIGTAIDKLPIVGTEQVDFKVTDNRGNVLEFGSDKNNPLYVEKITPIFDDTRKSMATIVLVSKAYLVNEMGEAQVNKCYEGKISQHVENILKENLKVEKKLDIEETGSKNFNYFGNTNKPFWCLNNLSSKAAPQMSGGESNDANTAGFLLYETDTSYHFKSLDTLLGQDPKKKVLYNESTPDFLPPEYDLKALSYSRDTAVNIKEKFRMGAYSTRCISFNIFSKEYKSTLLSADTTKQVGGSSKKSGEIKGNQEKLTKAAKHLPHLNSQFNSTKPNKEYTRTTWNIFDTGTRPAGNTKEQIRKSQEENFPLETILNQSIMRYNQLFAFTTTITIAGDFSLHAGDAILVDTIGLSNKTEDNDEKNKESGGVYIIADLAHYISEAETFTKLNLVRDSVGRKTPERSPSSSAPATPVTPRRPEGFMRVVTGIGDVVTGNRWDLDKRG